MHPPKQKNTTVEQSLRSDTSNSRSSEYILYWYTTRFNLAVWRGSLVEAKYTDLYKFSRLSKTPARSTLFQVDFDIVMYVNYNVLYLRSCIYYCMYLSIGVAMGNRDFSCTSKKVGLEYSLRLYLWQIFLILDCLVSMSCCASFPMPDIDAGEGSPSDKLELDVFIMDCLGFWMLLECSRPLEIRNCFPPNERTFARRPVSGSNCFTKRTAIVLIISIQFKSIFSGILEAVYSPSLSLHLPKVRNWTCQVSKCAVSKWMFHVVSTKVYGASQGSMTQGISPFPDQNTMWSSALVQCPSRLESPHSSQHDRPTKQNAKIHSSLATSMTAVRIIPHPPILVHIYQTFEFAHLTPQFPPTPFLLLHLASAFM